MNGENLYYEIQKSPKWFLLTTLVLFNGIFLFVIVSQYIESVDSGLDPIIDSNILISWSIVILMSVFFKIMRLETIIRGNGIYVRFFPIQLSFKFYSFESIGNCYINKLTWIPKFRDTRFFCFGRHRMIKMAGYYGMQLEFLNGSSLFIGTKNPEVIDKVLEQLRSKTILSKSKKRLI
ncbi:MAG: hypothetical protein RBR35_13955 [Salinivirgaceae bacterium]|nr:hypothetical protein [Salinivirgaceae bacterium]